MRDGWKRRLHAWRQRLDYSLGRPAPALVSIDVSGDCNLRCITCSLESSIPRKGMMTMERFERLSSQLRGIPIVELSSGCEPTLNRDLPSMLALVRRQHPAAFVELTTNATNLSDAVIEALMDSSTDKLLISLDGGEAEAYERIRVGARFDAVLANVRRLMAAKERRAAARPACEVIVTWMSHNRDQLRPLVDVLKDLGIASLIVNGLVPWSEDAGRAPMWGVVGEPPEAVALANDAARYGREQGVTLIFADFRARKVERCLDCNPVISWDGDVFPCFMTSFDRTFYYHGRHQRMPRIALGNVFEKDLPSIWRSPAAVSFRATRAMGQLPDYCRNCAMQMGILCPSRTLV